MIPLGSSPSVFQAELVAVTHVAEQLSQLGTRNKEIHIFSDCRSVLHALGTIRNRSKLLADCMEQLNKLAESNTVRLSWIPGHSGVPGNEAADKCAKLASLERPIGAEPFLPMPMDRSREALKKWLGKKHQHSWTNANGCRQAKESSPMVSEALANELRRLPRADLRNIVQVLTGHANLARHRYITKQSPSPLCEQCDMEVEETPWHHVRICPAFQATRDRLLGQVNTWTWKNLTENHIRELAAYLKEAKRLGNFSML